MTISEFAYQHRPVVFMLTAVLMVAGIIGYFTLPTREDPEITIREAVVTTEYPGLSAERMELLVTKTLEEAIRQIPEVEEIRSTSQAGLSTIHVELHDRIFELGQVWDEVRDKVESARPELPAGAGRPQVNDDFGDVAVVTAALTSQDFEMSALFDTAQHVRDLLYGVPGTKRVDLLGVQPERIYIEAANARLAEFGLNPQALAAILAQQNVIQPGGEVDTGERAFIIEPTGDYSSLEDIRSTLLRVPDRDNPDGIGTVVPLRDLAEVHRGYLDPPITKAYYNGQPAIVFAIAMASGNSVLHYGAQAKDKLQEIASSLPKGYQIDLVTHQADQVGKAVYGVTASVLQTLMIVLIMVILFLGIRTGLIVGSIVPAVMLIAIAFMGFMDMQLQRMSLATLVIALGLLVDNGIVIAEDFKRRLEEGISRADALKQTGSELAFPLLASSATTTLVFLPLLLAEHVAGEYTGSVSKVIFLTLSVSWVLALTLTPTLCYRFIRIDEGSKENSGEDKKAGLFDRFEGRYEGLLRGILRHRALFVVFMVVLLVVAMGGLRFAPKKFFPNSDRAQVLMYLDLPAGVTTRATDAVLNDLFEHLNDGERFPHIGDYAAYIGFGGPRFVLSLTPIDRAPNKAFVVLNIDQFGNMPGTIDSLRALFKESFPGVFAQVTSMFLGPSDSTKIEIQIRGPDADFIYDKARDIEAIVADVPGAINIRQDWENRITKLVVQVDQTRARRAGVTSADVAQGLSRAFSGARISEFREGDDVIPIVVRALDVERDNLDRAKSLTIYPGNGGDGVPLFQVAEFELKNEFARIEREGLIRTVTVEARNTQMTGEDMVPHLQPGLDKLQAELPPNHFIEYDGAVAQSADAQAALQANAPLCFLAILVLLVALFNSLSLPIIIFLTAPLVIIGAVVGLFVMNATFGFMEILGLYALAGIIMNNAIVLINRFEIERGLPDNTAFEAIVIASRRRLRPILMTTGTTILGLMPLIIGQDALFYGLACVIAFGLGVGTLLTLGMVPVLYSLFFRIPPPDDSREGANTARL